MRLSTNSKESDFEKKDQQLEAADLFSERVSFARGSVMNEGFIYKIIEKNAFVIVSFQGKITKDAKDFLLKCQQELNQIQCRNVIFYFKDVPSVDHIALRELTLIQSEVRKNGLALNIVGLSHLLKQFLIEKGVVRASEIRNSLEEALRNPAK